MTDTTVKPTAAAELTLADQLVDELADLLKEAAGLPRPQRLSVRTHSPVTAKPIIYLIFESNCAPVAALERWADRFGTTVALFPDDEHHEVSYHVVFDYLGVEIFAYAIIPATAPATL